MDLSTVEFLLVVLSVGIAAQWVGWKLKVPAILILLLTGFILGPVSGFLNPTEVFGDSLFPFVSLAVAIILFEGGLTLRFRDLKEVGSVITRIVLIGVIVTTLVIAWMSVHLFDFSWQMGLLLGALLSVTGPTVISPMLRMIRPKGNVRNIAKWEGIVNDPIGVLLAVLIFEVLAYHNVEQAPQVIAWGILKTIILSGGMAAFFSWAFIYLVKIRFLPEFLHNFTILVIVLVTFQVSNYFQHESGLATVTLLGIFFANQKTFPIKHIMLFKENLQVLLISTLFIILAARVDVGALKLLSWQSGVFVLGVIFLVRPLSVFLSTVGSKTTWAERIFLMFLAPRGIVAVALASIFVLKFQNSGVPNAEAFFAEILLVIFATVVFYGFTAGVIASKLGLTNLKPEGLLIVGAHDWSRTIAKKVKSFGIHVTMLDTNTQNIQIARSQGIDAHHGNVLSEEFLEELDLSEIGHAAVLTPNHEVNAFAQDTLIEFIERLDIHYLMPSSLNNNDAEHAIPLDPLFKEDVTYDFLAEQFHNGGTLKTITITDEEPSESWKTYLSNQQIPLFLINDKKQLKIFTKKSALLPTNNSTVIYLEIESSDPVPSPS